MALGLYVENPRARAVKGAWHNGRWMTDVEWEMTAKVENAVPDPGFGALEEHGSWIEKMVREADANPPSEEERRRDLETKARIFDMDVRTAERMYAILHEAGGSLRLGEICDRMVERWGECGLVDVVGPRAGVAYEDDVGAKFQLDPFPEHRRSEFDGYPWITRDGCVCIYRRTRAGETILPLSRPGLFSEEEFFPIRVGAPALSRPTPEVEACIARHYEGKATKGDVEACLLGASKALVAERLERWGDGPPPVLDPAAWRREADAHREIPLRY